MSENSMPTEAVETADTEPGMVSETLSDGASALFVADFSNADAAWDAYEALQAEADGRHLEVDGVVVVKRSSDGILEIQKATDHSTRKGLTWGVVGGAVLGILFPPSVIGSAVVLGAGGAVIGKARQLHHHHELADELGEAVEPGHSGLIALVSDPATVKVREALDKADSIVEKALDKAAADDIKAIAKEAKAADKAERKAAEKAAKAQKKAAKKAAKEAADSDPAPAPTSA